MPSVLEVSRFKDGLLRRAVMRKYSRFSMPFSIRIPAHPSKSQLRAFSKRRKNIPYQLLNTHSISYPSQISSQNGS